MPTWRLSSFLSNTCTLASGMLGREDVHVAGIAAGVYSLHVYLSVSSDVEMDAEMVLLVFVVGIVAVVYPLHLFLDVYSNVYIWKPQVGSLQSQQEESLLSGELIISLS